MIVIYVHDGGLMMGADGSAHCAGFFDCGVLLQNQTLNDISIRSSSWEYFWIWVIRGSLLRFPTKGADLVVVGGQEGNWHGAGVGEAGCLVNTRGDELIPYISDLHFGLEGS